MVYTFFMGVCTLYFQLFLFPYTKSWKIPRFKVTNGQKIACLTLLLRSGSERGFRLPVTINFTGVASPTNPLHSYQRMAFHKDCARHLTIEIGSRFRFRHLETHPLRTAGLFIASQIHDYQRMASYRDCAGCSPNPRSTPTAPSVI